MRPFKVRKVSIFVLRADQFFICRIKAANIGAHGPILPGREDSKSLRLTNYICRTGADIGGGGGGLNADFKKSLYEIH